MLIFLPLAVFAGRKLRPPCVEIEALGTTTDHRENDKLLLVQHCSWGERKTLARLR